MTMRVGESQDSQKAAQEAWRIKVLKMSFQDFSLGFPFLRTKTNPQIPIRKKIIDSLLRYHEISSKNHLNKSKINFLSIN